MQDDETKDAELICNRPGKGFRAACLELFYQRQKSQYRWNMYGFICFLVYHIQTLRS
jgi:hypothetical protein